MSIKSEVAILIVRYRCPVFGKPLQSRQISILTRDLISRNITIDTDLVSNKDCKKLAMIIRTTWEIGFWVQYQFSLLLFSCSLRSLASKTWFLSLIKINYFTHSCRLIIIQWAIIARIWECKFETGVWFLFWISSMKLRTYPPCHFKE